MVSIGVGAGSPNDSLVYGWGEYSNAAYAEHKV
jgi:hypothetical protein